MTPSRSSTAGEMEILMLPARPTAGTSAPATSATTPTRNVMGRYYWHNGRTGENRGPRLPADEAGPLTGGVAGGAVEGVATARARETGRLVTQDDRQREREIGLRHRIGAAAPDHDDRHLGEVTTCPIPDRELPDAGDRTRA